MFDDTSRSALFQGLSPESFLTALSDNAPHIALGLIGLVAARAIYKHRETIAIKLQLARLGFRYRKFRLARLLFPDRFGWFSFERLLCHDFTRPYIKSQKDLDRYDKAQSYLRKAHELGRRPMPIWLKSLLSVLVFTEAAVFAMVLSEFGLESVTPHQQPYYAALIGLVLAIVLMLSTHLAGAEWHQNDLIEKAGDMGRETLRGGNSQSVSALSTNTKISIAQDHLDDDAPIYLQMLNRLDTNYSLTPKWAWTKGTLIFIAALMVLSFIVRLSVTDLVEPAYASEPNSLAALSMDGMDDLFPDAPASTGPSDSWSATGKLSTLIIFTMIFLGIQGISIYLARAYGFASLEGRRAYEVIRKFQTREEFINHQLALQTEIANAAQTRLCALQETIIEALSERGVDAEAFTAARFAANRTFLAFIHAKHHQEKTHEYEDM